MNPLQDCLTDRELEDLLDGKLVDPELSAMAQHLEDCLKCQHRVGVISSNLTALNAMPDTFDHIVHQTPKHLIERIKLIPSLPSEGFISATSESITSEAQIDSVHFSSDPTPGGHGVLGPYRILKLLGSGGMGSVFLAEDTKLHRQVALKIMLPKIAKDPVAKERFMREARAAASLRSEHIIRIYQVDEEDDLPYLTMEYLEGGSLDEFMKSTTQLSVTEILSISCGITKGLIDAHESGLIHRDIKPGNIWVRSCEDGSAQVKILDFGLARVNLDESQLTHANAIVGTPAFMAPEQARGEKLVDARSDLFSFGCVLYYLCTHEIPFKSESTLGTLMALAVDTPTPPSSLNPAVPDKLSDLVMSLLQKNSESRPQSARAVLETLNLISRQIEQGIATFGTDRMHSIPDKKQLKKDRISRVKLLGLSGAIVLVIAAIVPLMPGSMKSENLKATDEVKSPDLNEKSSTSTRSGMVLLRKVADQLKIDNESFSGSLRPTFENEDVTGLIVSGSNLSSLNAIAELKSLNSLIIEGFSTWDSKNIDLSPIRDLKLRKLALQGGYVVSTIEPLRDMPLEELKLDYSPISDLSPLEGKPLRELFLWSWAGSDLSPLKGMPLKQLNIGGSDNVSDLSPLAGAPLEFLCVNISKVRDLSPLRGSPLKQLSCSNCLVEDLSPLADSPIEELMVDGTFVRDPSAFTKWPLKWAKFDLDLDDWESVLRKIPSIEKIHQDPASEVLAAHERTDWNEKAPDFISSRGMEFVLVPKGNTVRTNGNMDQLIGAKEIEITEDFYLGKFEVTQSQWQDLMGTNPSFFSTNGPGENRLKTLSLPERGRLPVEKVSWQDCQAFLEKLNGMEDDPEWTYRLPTEAEWTYACHGAIPSEDGKEQCSYFFKAPSKSLPNYSANFNRSDLKRTSKVGSFPPNRLGLHDMHGNVWEWCHDQPNIPGKQARWIHGGGWKDDAEKCSSSFVREPTEAWLYYDLGFRVARIKK